MPKQFGTQLRSVAVVSRYVIGRCDKRFLFIREIEEQVEEIPVLVGRS